MSESFLFENKKFNESESFLFENKRKLADRIQKIVSKKDLIQIKNIIIENNPDLPFMKNGNGYFMQFQNLSHDTYMKLTDFLDSNEKHDENIKIKEMTTEILDSSELISDELTAITDTDETSECIFSKKLRLTNTESHILNRVKYEKELKKNECNSNEDDTYFSYDNIKTKEIFVQNESSKNKKNHKKN